MEQPDVRDYLARLRCELDNATLRAVLGLLVTEGREQISKQRTFIGLGRLGKRCTDADIARLRRLEAVQEILTSSLAHLRESPPERAAGGSLEDNFVGNGPSPAQRSSGAAL